MRQFAVIGLGRFGSSVVKTLGEKGQQVLAVDISEELVQDMAEIATHAVCVDATDEKAMKAIGIKDVNVAIVAIGANVEASILVTLILKEAGIPEIVAKAVSEEQGKVLKRVGATRVVFPERDMGARLANSLISSKVIEHIELSSEYSIAEVLPTRKFINKTLRDIDLRAEYGVTVIAVKRKIQAVAKNGEAREEEKITVSPQADYQIRNGDIMVVLGSNENIEKIKAKH